MAEGGKSPPAKGGATGTLASPGARSGEKRAPESVPPTRLGTGLQKAPASTRPSAAKTVAARPVKSAKESPERKIPTPNDVRALKPPPADLGASLELASEREAPRQVGARILGTPLEEGSGKIRAVTISIPPDPSAPPKIRDHHASIRPEGAESLVGAIVGGRYRIDRLLGEGAMGAVFLAEHRLMRKKVALKVLHPQWSKVQDIVSRFEREAMAASRIEHPNVAAATDFGQLEDGAFFLVLEFVEGRTLRQEIALGPFPVPRALAVLRQMTSALVKAHGLGIVHRDLKPENVMLIERGENPDFVKVLDFGIAKITEGDLDRTGTPKTEAGMVYGTPEYMAPEQALGQEIDGRADLYAIGVIAYELLTGRRPFHAENKLALLGMHVHADVPPMSDRAPDAAVPPMVERFVSKLLAKKPEARFHDAKVLLAAIDDLIAELKSLGLFDDQDFRALGSVRDLRSPRAVELASGHAIESVEFAATAVVPSDAVPFTEVMARDSSLGVPSEQVPNEERPRKRRLRASAVAGIAAGAGALLTVLALQLARGGGDAPTAKPTAAPVPRSAYIAERTLPAPSSEPAGGVVRAAPIVIESDREQLVAPPAALAVPPPPAPTLPPAVDPESAIRRAQELVNADQTPRALAVLEEALAVNPNHPGLALALFKARLGGSSRAATLAAAHRWLETDPNASLSAGPQLAALVDDAIAANDGLDEAFKILEQHMGPRGTDKLYDLAYGAAAASRPLVAARARTGLQFSTTLSKASPSLRIALQVRAAQGCEEISALLRRVRDVGDERSAALLRPYEKTDGCKGTDCYPCLRGTSDLANAIVASEKRAGAR